LRPPRIVFRSPGEIMEVTMERTAVALGISLALTLFPGCMGESGPSTGIIDVSWQVKNSTCSNAGISTVQLDLLQDSGRVLTRREPCTDGTMTIPDVEAGTYELRLQGLDSNDLAIYQAEVPQFKVSKGTKPSSPAGVLELEQIQGSLLLQWMLPRGAASCSFAGLANIEVNVNQKAML